MHLACEESLLDTNVATRRVFCPKAIQKSAVALPFAIAIAGLLCENLRDFLCYLVCLPNISTLELNRIERRRKRHRIRSISEIDRDGTRCRILPFRRFGAECCVENARENQNCDDHHSNEMVAPP